jgi:hypothetical protein
MSGHVNSKENSGQLRKQLHQSHRVAPPPIRFPSSGVTYTSMQKDSRPQESSDNVDERTLLSRSERSLEEGKPGLPKLSRECLWS